VELVGEMDGVELAVYKIVFLCLCALWWGIWRGEEAG
jgi:hypothetical protein